jgi:hypothetical protein
MLSAIEDTPKGGIFPVVYSRFVLWFRFPKDAAELSSFESGGIRWIMEMKEALEKKTLPPIGGYIEAFEFAFPDGAMPTVDDLALAHTLRFWTAMKDDKGNDAEITEIQAIKLCRDCVALRAIVSKIDEMHGRNRIAMAWNHVDKAKKNSKPTISNSTGSKPAAEHFPAEPSEA